MLTFTILSISFFLLLVHGSPLVLRDVFNPTILTPNKDTVWVTGTTQTVTWYAFALLLYYSWNRMSMFCVFLRQTSNIPSNLTNPNGTVLLGHLGPGGENLQIGKPVLSYLPLGYPC